MLKYPFFADHKVESLTVFPGAGYIEAVLETILKDGNVVLEDLHFVKPLFWPPANKVTLQIARDGNKFEVFTVSGDFKTVHLTGIYYQTWIIHVLTLVIVGSVGGRQVEPPKLDLEGAFARCGTKMSRQEVYQLFDEQNFHYGPSFQVIQEAFRGDREV